MAGLLDGLTGDDTTKDEFGQTQADRRAPIWSGLINAGLLAMAGGGNLMPSERAKYIAQAGGALGGIGTDMIQARSAAAQQALRGQQLDEGKRKIADRDRLRAMAQAPEWQEQMKTLDPATRALLTAAIDAGDLTHASAIMANSDKSGNRAAQLDIAQQRADLARQKLEQAQGGAFQGNGMDAQAMNTLIKGEVGSVAYYLAYNHLAKARTTIDAATGQPVTVQPLDLRRFKPPTWDGGGATPPPAPAPDGTTTSPAPAPASAGTTTPAPDGTTTPPPAPAGSPTVTTGAPVVPKPVPEATIKVFATNMGQLNKIDTVLDDLKNNPDIKVGTAMTQVLGRLPIGSVGTDMLNQQDPKGVRARALIADIGSLVLHDRSGAAVTASEYPRLAPFIPKVTDPPEVIRTKLANFQKQLELETRYHYENLPAASRAQAPPDVTTRFGKPAGGGAPKPKTYNPATGEIE